MQPTEYYIEPTQATRVRVHEEAPGAWAIDAADDAGRFTDVCWNRDGHPEAKLSRDRAIALVPAFSEQYGVLPWLPIYLSPLGGPREVIRAAQPAGTGPLDTLPPVRDCDRAICESAMEALNLAREAGRIVRVRLFSGDCDGARIAVGPAGEWIVEEEERIS